MPKVNLQGERFADIDPLSVSPRHAIERIPPSMLDQFPSGWNTEALKRGGIPLNFDAAKAYYEDQLDLPPLRYVGQTEGPLPVAGFTHPGLPFSPWTGISIIKKSGNQDEDLLTLRHELNHLQDFHTDPFRMVLGDPDRKKGEPPIRHHVGYKHGFDLQAPLTDELKYRDRVGESYDPGWSKYRKDWMPELKEGLK